MDTDTVSNSEKQALAQYESIANYVAAYEFAQEHEREDLTDADVIAEMDEDQREEFERLVAETDFSAEDLSDPDVIRERIEQDPLSIEVIPHSVMHGWTSVSDCGGS